MCKKTVARKNFGSEIDKSCTEKKRKKICDSSPPSNVHKKLKITKAKTAISQPVKIKTVSRPHQLFEFFKTMSNEQRKDIEDIGFGGLIKLEAHQMPTGPFLNFILEKFNPFSNVFNIGPKAIVLNENDMADVFMLPRNPGNLVRVYQKGKKNCDHELFKTWKENYGLDISKQISLQTLLFLMNNTLSMGGEDFKRFFVLFAMSSFLAPQPNKSVNFNLVASLINAEKIAELDWCEYVFENLCVQLRKYHKHKNDPRDKDEIKVGGCLLFLMIEYFHRYPFQGRPEPTTLPLAQHWTTTAIRERIRLESRDPTGFGSCPPDENTYPITKGKLVSRKMMQVRPLAKEEEKREKKGKSSEKEHQNVGKKSNVEKPSNARSITFVLPQGCMTDEEISVSTKDPLQQQVLRFHRDVEVVMKQHMDKFQEFLKEAKMKTNEREEEKESEEEQGDSQRWTQLLEDPTVIEHIDQIIQNFCLLKEMKESMPSFSLGIPKTPTRKKSSGEEDEDAGTVVSMINDVLSDIQELDEETTPQKAVIGETEAEGFEEEPNKGCTGDKFSEIMERRSKKRDDSGQFQKRMISLDMGEKNKDVLMINDMMKTRFCKESIFSEMETLMKEVADYCLFDDPCMNSEEVVVSYSGFEFITRKEMVTMNMFRYISSAIIDCWSWYMMGMDEPTRFYFNIAWENPLNHIIDPDETEREDTANRRKEIRNSWRQWVKINPDFQQRIQTAKMVFLPLWIKEIKHFAAICINFDKKAIQYLDNIKQDDMFVNQICQIVAYERRFIRAHITATLVLADINIKRDEVLKNVQQFTKNKPEMIEQKEREKKREQEKQKKEQEEKKKAELVKKKYSRKK